MQNKAFSHITDQELLENFYKSHDNKWLGILLPRYTLLLFGVCMKYLKNEEEAKDSVQQVFLKSITELHKYEVAYFKSWIYTIARNHCLMHLRNQDKRTVEINEKLMESKDDIRTNHPLENEKLLQAMSDSLQELNKEQKECVTLFYLDKKSYQEVADKTGYSLMQVKSYIQNGKRNLKLLVDKKLNQAS